MKFLDFLGRNKQLKEFVNYSFWSIVGTAISKLFLFLIWIFIANLLGALDYGKFSMIRSTTLLFSEFVGMSFGIAATKYVAESLKNITRLRRLIFNLLFLCGVLGVLFSFAFWFVSEDISVYLIKSPDLINNLSCTSIVLLCSTFSNCQLGILRGFGEFKLISKINFIQVVFSLPVYYFATLYWKLDGAVWAYVWYNVVIVFITQFYLYKECGVRDVVLGWKIDFQILVSLLKYILPFFGAAFFERLGFWYNETRLVALPDTGFTMMGTYSSVMILHITLISAVVLLCQPFVSLMSKYKTEEGNDFMISLNYYMPILLGMVLVLPFLLVPEVYDLLYSSEYSSNETYVLVVLIMSYLPLVLYRHAMSRVVAVYEKQLIQLLDAALMAIIMIAGFICFYDWGVIAMVGSTLVAYICSIVIFTPIYVHSGMIKASLLINRYMLWGIVLYIGIICLYFMLTDKFVIRCFVLVSVYIGVGGWLLRFIKKKTLC